MRVLSTKPLQEMIVPQCEAESNCTHSLLVPRCCSCLLTFTCRWLRLSCLLQGLSYSYPLCITTDDSYFKDTEALPYSLHKECVAKARRWYTAQKLVWKSQALGQKYYLTLQSYTYLTSKIVQQHGLRMKAPLLQPFFSSSSPVLSQIRTFIQGCKGQRPQIPTLV